MEVTLKSLFESQKEQLENQLSGLSLPKDNGKVERIVGDYLSGLLESDGEFRQNLTQAENYILQASISLLNAQKAVAGELSKSMKGNPEFAAHAKKGGNADTFHAKEPEATPQSIFNNKSVNASPTYTIGGTAVGGVVGAVAFGSWGAVFGAIAGTAVALYYASLQPKTTVKAPSSSAKALIPTQTPLDTAVFIRIVGNICECVDTIIDTFRAQVNRVVGKYESQEKPTLEKDYRFLLEGIQTLLGYKRTHSEQEEKYVSKLGTRIEDVAELLENYDLTVEDYSEDNEQWFEKIVKPEVTSAKMVCPAIVKNGQVVLKGKVFVNK